MTGNKDRQYDVQSRLLAIKQKILQRRRDTDDYELRDAAPDVLGELSFYDNHPADIASEVYERAKDVALRDADNLQLAAVDRALAKLGEGTYGVCDKCHRPIAEERMETMPAANLCVECKEEDERQHPDRMRPIEEEYLYPGFGRSDLDDTSATYFDGEDAWQAVARYNERPEYEQNPDLGWLDDNEGLVERTDGISNDWYKRNRLS